MNLLNKLINVLTYIGAICFVMSIMLVGTLGVKMVIELLPTYFPDMKSPKTLEYMLWGGLIFIIFLNQQFTYRGWKKYLKLS
jgi:hypothetical protein